MSSMVGSAAAKAPSFLSRLGLRVLVHFASLLAAGVVAGKYFADISTEGETIILIYLGLICLFPRGQFSEPDWYVPTGCGLLQGLVLLLCGIPLPHVFFWSGVQTWLQRLVSRKGKMGWEWSVLPWLLICATDVPEYPALGIPFWPLLTVPVILLLGGIGWAVYQKTKAESIHARSLAATIARLSRLVESRMLPADLDQQTRLLLTQTSAYSRIPDPGEDGYARVEYLAGMANELTDVLKDVQAARGGSVMGSQWLGGVLKSGAWKVPGKRNLRAEKALKSVCDLNAELMEWLKNHRKPEDDAKIMEIAGAEAWEAQAWQILQRKDSLPPTLGKPLERIAYACFDIVQDVRADQNRYAGCHRFVERYLPAALKIEEEYRKLVGKGTSSGDAETESAISRSVEILERMAAAFEEEHAGMVKSDTMNYTAELNALDAMLKMSGR